MSISDIDIDKAIVQISAEGRVISLELTNENKTVTGLKPFNGNYGDLVKLPDKNGGLTYVFNMTTAGFSSKPDKVEVAPVVGGTQCGVSDIISSVASCSFI